MACDVFMIILRDEAKNENSSVYTVEAGKRVELEGIPGNKGLVGMVIDEGKSVDVKR